MKSYDNLIDALKDLRNRGYSLDFNLHGQSNKLLVNEIEIHPEHFKINEIYRFEGMSNPDDSSVLYAIESKYGTKGVLVDSYGMYAESFTPEMVIKIKQYRKDNPNSTIK